ncbi:MAG: transposase [Candidatus Levybacteria bacterium]|nr:transposase [Candidatus Levybacteria bacterium]
MDDDGKLPKNTYLHVMNLGIEKRLVFMDKKDLDRFIDLLNYYQFENPPARFSFRKRPGYERDINTVPLVKILSFLMMPDHFHLILEQGKPEGVSRFMALVTNSYTKYFNSRHKRSGPLFKGIFKRAEIQTLPELLDVASFIHLEPLKKGLVDDLKRFPFSSFHEYAEIHQGFCAKDAIMKNFADPNAYQNYLLQEHNLVNKNLFLE